MTAERDAEIAAVLAAGKIRRSRRAHLPEPYDLFDQAGWPPGPEREAMITVAHGGDWVMPRNVTEAGRDARFGRPRSGPLSDPPRDCWHCRMNEDHPQFGPWPMTGPLCAYCDDLRLLTRPGPRQYQCLHCLNPAPMPRQTVPLWAPALILGLVLLCATTGWGAGLIIGLALPWLILWRRT